LLLTIGDEAMRILSAIILMSTVIFGCTGDKETVNDNQEDVVTVNDADDTNADDNEPVPSYLFEPDLVFFYSTLVVDNETDIGCFDDSDSSPYCGVFRYMVVNYDDWEGLDDMGHACHIIHKIDPENVSSDGPVVDADWHGWTFDGSQSFVEKSLMCDFIDPDSEAGLLVERFTSEPFSAGIGPINEDMVDSFRQYIVNSYDQETWDTGFAPYLLASSVSVGGFSAQPNFMYAVERDENGVPVVVDSYYQPIETGELDSLVNAWYRTRTWYGYTLDKFVE